MSLINLLELDQALHKSIRVIIKISMHAWNKANSLSARETDENITEVRNNVPMISILIPNQRKEVILMYQHFVCSF